MAEPELIEADFHQYYHLDYEDISFSKCARLLSQLPLESRFIQKYCETKDWNWDKETNARILHKLDTISCQLANMVKKKSTKTIKPEKLFEPDYVAKAKEESLKREKERKKLSDEDMQAIKLFWEKRNHNVKKMEEK